MIRAATFVPLAALAVAFLQVGWALWPIWLTLAAVICLLGLLYRDRDSAMVAAIIGSGIIVMALPAPDPFKWYWACWMWTFIALAVAKHNPRAGYFVWAMVVGYLGLYLRPTGVPVEVLWLGVEVPGLVALLCAGEPLDRAVGYAVDRFRRFNRNPGAAGGMVAGRDHDHQEDFG